MWSTCALNHPLSMTFKRVAVIWAVTPAYPWPHRARQVGVRGLSQNSAVRPTQPAPQNSQKQVRIEAAWELPGYGFALKEFETALVFVRWRN